MGVELRSRLLPGVVGSSGLQPHQEVGLIREVVDEVDPGGASCDNQVVLLEYVDEQRPGAEFPGSENIGVLEGVSDLVVIADLLHVVEKHRARMEVR